MKLLISAIVMFLLAPAMVLAQSKVDLANALKDSISKPVTYADLARTWGALKSMKPNEVGGQGEDQFPRKPSGYAQFLKGSALLTVNGRPVATDRTGKAGSYVVWIAGPNAAPSDLWLRSDLASSESAGPRYLRSKGIKLETIACEKEGKGNYTALFRASVAGSKPALLEITESTGSGGTWFSYRLRWKSVSPADLPDQAEVGLCDVDG
jgi:hypothetical protein